VNASSRINTGIGALTAGLESLKNNVTYAQYKAALTQAGLPDPSAQAAQNAQAAAGVQASIDGIDALIDRAKAANDAASETTLTNLKQSMARMLPLLQGNSAAFSGADRFNRGYFENINAGIAQLYEGVFTLQTDYAAFHGAISGFVDALSGLTASVSKLAPAINALSTEYNALDEGVAAYTSGVSEVTGGYARVVSGVSALAEGSKGLAAGASGIYRASLDMAGGAGTLLDGIEALRDGTGAFRRETSGMETEIANGIDSAIGAITGKSGKTVSFASTRNENVASVQFAVKTEAIHVPDDDEKTVVKEEPTTLWQKFLHLFE
jgi:putative membrane protein